ncbi:hypothetical protein HZS_5097 [Henneguya salminicola]|uniref:Aflatoxin B1 aldehyde reductase member 3 (Trinotate prediction) n=1 Tax=Henneguya salminicola TaxID=69463 RepID=A0A6G3MIN1_HENSL|nr:hypothetical protein HZS_5097 [Henneguya salminicola]
MNLKCREVEKELIPCLRDYGISFYAYNPLAGGLLTGRYKFTDKDSWDIKTKCRFHGLGGASSKMYQDRFWHKNYFTAIDRIKNSLPITKTMAQSSLDWLINHSHLSTNHGDAIIIGASTLDQYKNNMEIVMNSEPLPTQAVKCINQAYLEISGCVATYYR